MNYSPARALSPPSRTWRATTAARVFGLALALGQVLEANALARALPALVALVLLATVASAIEAGRSVRMTWIPIVEALLVASLLAGLLPGGTLHAYLAVPAVVAGIGQGWVTAVNATLTGSLSFYAASMSTRELFVVPDGLAAGALWLTVGLGGGLLAGWQTRSLRKVESRQAPYAAAHRLVAQLSDLTQTGGLGLDSVMSARRVGALLAEASGAAAWAIFARRPDETLEALATYQSTPDYSRLAARLGGRRRGTWYGGTAVLPLRVGDHVFGVAVLHASDVWSKCQLNDVQHVADEHAVRLETSLLFDQVRVAATSEERQRLARDIHDGVAQEMVALAYLVDEIADTSAEAETLLTAATLRQEISRVVGELRMSIYDLRHEVAQQHLSGALAEYVREASARTKLRVHLSVSEQGPRLPARTESELLRIAQEAIGNARKHAHADNLWVTFATDGDDVRLELADDGVGSAAPRHRHYGLHTMKERAERLGADLTVRERPGGGTVVSLIAGRTHLGPPLNRAELTA